MATITTSAERTQRRPVLAALTALNAVSAWAGAIGLASGWLTLGATVEQRLPLDSPVLAGVALATVVAAPSTVVAVEALSGSPYTDASLIGAGVLLVGWIVVEVAFIREFSFFQPVYLAVGASMVVVGVHGWRSHRAERPQD